jgi:hypothetical protein
MTRKPKKPQVVVITKGQWEMMEAWRLGRARGCPTVLSKHRSKRPGS